MVSRRTLLHAGVGATGLAVVGAPLWSTAGARPATVAMGWDRLRRSFTGDIFLPGDPGYDKAKQLDNRAFDNVRPLGIAYCENSQDVRDCLMFAQDNDVPVALRSGGHSSAGYSTTDGLVLDTSRLNQVKLGRSSVTLGPGAQGVDIVANLAPNGLAVVTGNCPTVCAGGYIQGGGIGPLARKFGVGSDRLIAAEVVLADGRVVQCSEKQEPALFWALRGGGGGNFGVVTRYQVEPSKVSKIASFGLIWPWAKAADVIAAYQPWLEQGPDDLNANLTVLHENATPDSEPEVMLSGGWLGDPAELDRLLNELISAVGSKPQNRSVDNLSYYDSMMRMFGCSDKTVQECHRVGLNPEAALPRHGFTVARSELFDAPMGGAGIDEALTAFAANPVAGQARVMSWGGLGGQINQVERTATAYVHRNAQQNFNVTGSSHSKTPTQEEKAAIQQWTDRGFAVGQRYGNGESQVNFIDSRLSDWQRAYYAENYDPLVRIKRNYDPHDFFSFAQSVDA